MQFLVLIRESVERLSQVCVLTLRKSGLHLRKLLLNECASILHLESLTLHEILCCSQFLLRSEEFGFGLVIATGLRIGSPIA